MNQKEKLSDRIAEQLITLVSSEFKEGDKLPTEPELAALFSVSRITIREAVGKLATYGILEVKQGDGTFVKSLSPSSFMKPIIPMLKLSNAGLIDIFEVRLLLECKAAEDAATHVTKEELIVLKENVDRMNEAAMKNDMDLYNSLDVMFHMLIAKASHNQVLYTIDEILMDLIRETIRKTCTDLQQVMCSIIFHNKIFQAISNHEAKAAYDAMHEHVINAMDFIKQESSNILERAPQLEMSE